MAEQNAAPRASMLQAALFYARLGYAVFPLHHVLADGGCSCRKCPPEGKSIGKHPRTRDGFKSASKDRATIEGWWGDWPEANIGVATGEYCGAVVVDVDGADGEKRLAELEAEHGPLPECPVSTTGRGRHLWFHDPGRDRIRNSSGKLPVIDVRATGGYVVVPPSMHKSGVRYVWGTGKSVRELEPPTMPEWLLGLFASRKPSPSHGDPLLDALQRRITSDGEVLDAPPVSTTDLSTVRRRRWLENAIAAEASELARMAPNSGRNNALNEAAFKLGGYLPHGLVDKGSMVDALMVASTRNGLVGEDGHDSILAMVRRVLDDGASKPRAIPAFNDGPSHARRAPAPPERDARAPRAGAADPPDDGAPPPSDGDEPWDGGPESELPVIFDELDEDKMARLADRYLADDPELFQRGGLLVQVLRDDAPGAGVVRSHQQPRIAQMAEAWLRALSTRRISWRRKTRDKKGEPIELRIKPPRHAIAAIVARRHWQHIRKLEGVVVTPFFAPNGSIVSSPGYDASTGVLLEPYAKFEAVKDKPTQQDVDDAIEALRAVVCDVPFEKKEHESCYFAAILTPLARFAFHGPSPLFLVDANTPGTGKGLLAKVIGIIATGSVPTIIVQSKDDAEERKRITSVAMEGDQMVMIDNVEGRFGSPAMCAALTSAEWSDRVLGGSTSYKGPLLTTWLVTANNAQLATDMIRRTAHIRLLTNEERPEERTKFVIADLEAYVREHRPRLVRAALTILRAWHVAGRPRAKLPAWGSFEGWSSVVREAVVWAGLPDPAITRTQLREVSDSATDSHLELLEGMVVVMPAPNTKLSAGELIVKAKADGGTQLREALEGQLNGRALTAKGVGRLLTRIRGRIVDGRRIQGEKSTHRKQWVWWVERADGGEVELPPVG